MQLNLVNISNKFDEIEDNEIYIFIRFKPSHNNNFKERRQILMI